jgi:hypothetical protein
MLSSWPEASVSMHPTRVFAKSCKSLSTGREGQGEEVRTVYDAGDLLP